MYSEKVGGYMGNIFSSSHVSFELYACYTVLHFNLLISNSANWKRYRLERSSSKVRKNKVDLCRAVFDEQKFSLNESRN